jgi:hypothetical protein
MYCLESLRLPVYPVGAAALRDAIKVTHVDVGIEYMYIYNLTPVLRQCFPMFIFAESLLNCMSTGQPACVSQCGYQHI